MKRMIAILVLVCFSLATPVAALAALPTTDRHGPAQTEAAPSDLALVASQLEDDGQDEFVTLGDPDCLGGGFRGTGAPPSSSDGETNGFAGWVHTLLSIMFQLH
jgi:hypothetical protein